MDREGDDLRISWSDATADRPCVLYRLYVARDVQVPDSFERYDLLVTTAKNEFLHADAAMDGSTRLDYLLVGFHPSDGEGDLGHYGR